MVSKQIGRAAPSSRLGDIDVWLEGGKSLGNLKRYAAAIVFDAGSTYRLSAPWHRTSFGSWVW